VVIFASERRFAKRAQQSVFVFVSLETAACQRGLGYNEQITGLGWIIVYDADHDTKGETEEKERATSRAKLHANWSLSTVS